MGYTQVEVAMVSKEQKKAWGIKDVIPPSVKGEVLFGDETCCVTWHNIPMKGC